jgi:hypothetical protein
MRPGEDLESLTEQIFRVLTAGPGNVSVERNVQMPGADGPRQIDVVVRSSVGPIDLTTIIECRDYERTVNVTAIDGFHSVIQDVNASQGVIVTRKGFSKTAVQKAKRLGIRLLVADRLSNLRETVFDVPVYLREVRQIGFHLSFEFEFKEHTSVAPDALRRLNDLDFLQVLRNELLTEESIARHPSGRHAWQSDAVKPPYFIRDVQGRPCTFGSLEVTYEVREKHYFGYLGAVDGVLLLHDQAQKRATLLLPAEALNFDYGRRFVEFSRVDDLPVLPSVSLTAVVTPDPESFDFGAPMIQPLGPAPAPAD